jgi:hypothetical protein
MGTEEPWGHNECIVSPSVGDLAALTRRYLDSRLRGNDKIPDYVIVLQMIQKVRGLAD